MQTKLKEPCYAKEYKTLSRKIHNLKLAHLKKITVNSDKILTRRAKSVERLNDLIKQREEMRV